MSIKKLNLLLKDKIIKNQFKRLATLKNSNQKNENNIWYVNIMKKEEIVKKTKKKQPTLKTFSNKINNNQKKKDKIWNEKIW